MTSQVLISTTGTLSPVIIDDLGAIQFVHPTVDQELILPEGFLTLDEYAASDDLQAALDAGYITLTDENGNPITDTSQAFANFPSYLFNACSFQTTATADWQTNDFASLTLDSNNSAIQVRRFDDTTNEGVGFLIHIPDGATNISFKFVSRAETAPGSTQTVSTFIGDREIPDNGAIPAWNTTHLVDLSIPNNELWQYDSESFLLTTLGINAGSYYQFQLVRDGAGTLVGDWTLLSLKVEFS